MSALHLSLLRHVRVARSHISVLSRGYAGGDPGSGTGKGGGTGGSIRDAGGSFGKMEQAHEEQYFRKLQAELLSKIKKEHEEQVLYHDDEIKFHEDAIRRHAESIERHKKLKDEHKSTLEQQD